MAGASDIQQVAVPTWRQREPAKKTFCFLCGWRRLLLLYRHARFCFSTRDTDELLPKGCSGAYCCYVDIHTFIFTTTHSLLLASSTGQVFSAGQEGGHLSTLATGRDMTSQIASGIVVVDVHTNGSHCSQVSVRFSARSCAFVFAPNLQIPQNLCICRRRATCVHVRQPPAEFASPSFNRLGN